MTGGETGVWLIGARGNVATTATVGALAVAAGETDATGMVTGRAPYARLDLPAVEELVFGGHDVRERSMVDTARALAESGTPPERVVDAVESELRAVDERVRTGTAVNCGRAVDDLADETLDSAVADVVERIRADYREFAGAYDLDRVVVINAASTEPPVTDPDRYDTREAVEAAIADGDRDLPASALYAYAALVDGRPYVNFTPSTGSALGGLGELADAEGVPHVGRDAKTGETLVKSALAPMFAMRNLRVRSWEGHNVLGNDDGLVLEDEENEAGKLQSKGGVLDGILGDEFHNSVHIDYAPPLGDWKTAWDDIRFRGFLGTDMRMQFTWDGSDSALAAPLVLDLARLIAHADESGEAGLQTQLASFFKEPLGVEEHGLSRQFERLDEYAARYLDGADADERAEPSANASAGDGTGVN